MFEKIGNRFRREVKAFAAANQIPILALKKPDRSRWDDRKLDHVRPYLDAAERDGRFGVVAIVSPRSSSGCSTPPSAPAPAVGSGSSSPRPNGGSGSSTSTCSTPSSGRGSSRSAPTSRIQPRCGSTGTSGPNAKPTTPGSATRRWPTGSPPVTTPTGCRRSATGSDPADVQGFFDRWIDVIPTPFTADRSGRRLLVGAVDAPSRGVHARWCSTTPAGPAGSSKRSSPTTSASAAPKQVARRLRPRQVAPHAPSSRSGPGSSPPAPT